MSLECFELMQSLERATARLAGLNPEDFEQVGRAMRERRLAIEAMGSWVAAECQASRPVSPDLIIQLNRALEKGADTLVRLALIRQATLKDLQNVRRELQLLHGLSEPVASPSRVIDCQA